MRPSLARRSAVALALAVTLVAGLATPAAAGSASFDIVSGELEIALEVLPLVGPDECSQPLPTPAFTFTFTGNGSSGTWTVSGSVKSRFRLYPPEGAQYWQADITVLAGSGSYSLGFGPVTHALASTAPIHLTLQANIYRLTPPSCAKTDLACVVRFRLVLSGGSGASIPSMPNPAGGDWVRLEGTTNTTGGIPVTVVSGPCPAVITSRLVGQHVEVDSNDAIVLVA